MSLKILIKTLIEKVHQISTYYLCLKRYLRINPEDKILDIACGKGSYLVKFVKKRFKNTQIVGVDIYLPYLKINRENNLFSECVLADVRCLPFKSASFDVIFILELLEHLKKNEGLKLLENTENVCRKQIIITTPNGFMPQNIINGNVTQRHISAWYLDDFRNNGYDVMGLSGSKWQPFRSSNLRYLNYLLNLFTYLLQPLFYLAPEKAPRLVCVKNIYTTQSKIQ